MIHDRQRIPLNRPLVFALALLIMMASAYGQPTQTPYDDVFYSSGKLRIEAYLYKPQGSGPFPVVIYNHGSREGLEHNSVPFQYIGTMLVRAGYVALVPERRGYGRSDDQPRGGGYDRAGDLQAETDDVLAAVDYLRTLPFVDTDRMGIMGWSYGGIVTMLAISRSNAFTAAVNQAGGALTWFGDANVRVAVTKAAEQATTPTLFMVAKNDRTTSSVVTPAEIFERRGLPHRLVIYDAFTPSRDGIIGAPGHSIFSMLGVRVWEHDVVEFLNRYLKQNQRTVQEAQPK
jgi:dienelactone hydrolase